MRTKLIPYVVLMVMILLWVLTGFISIRSLQTMLRLILFVGVMGTLTFVTHGITPEKVGIVTGCTLLWAFIAAAEYFSLGYTLLESVMIPLLPVIVFPMMYWDVHGTLER